MKVLFVGNKIKKATSSNINQLNGFLFYKENSITKNKSSDKMKQLLLLITMLLIFPSYNMSSYAFEIKCYNLEISTINAQNIKSINFPYDGFINTNYDNND